MSIPDELGYERAAPRLCAGIATFNALKKSGVEAGDIVATLGIGGLGRMALQHAHKMDFNQIRGSGPAGRILHADLDAALNRAKSDVAHRRTENTEVKVVGLRRRIAERMAASVHEAAHFSYIEEVEVEQLEEHCGAG